MATITSTPVQVPSNGQYTQFTNQQNPFYVEIGANLYQVLFSSQGTSPANKIGIFKRAVTSVGGAWAEQDAAHSPDQGNQSGYGMVSVSGTTITVAYLQTGQVNLVRCTFDTTTGLWGTPSSAFVLPQAVSYFAFVQRSDSVYVVIAATTFRLYYLTSSGTGWSARTEVLPSGGNVLSGVVDTSDNIHFLFNIFVSGAGVSVIYLRLSSTYVLVNPLMAVANSVSFAGGGLPAIMIWGTKLVITYFPTSGPGAGTARALIGSPLPNLTNADFTDVLIYTPSGLSEHVSYLQPAIGTGSILTVFFVDTNFTIGINQIMQAIFNGLAWSVSIFYDAITNPALNALAGSTSAQRVQTAQGIQLTAGWTVATSVVIEDAANPPATFVSAEFLEASVSPPVPPSPPPPSGPGTITCQITILPAGDTKTLRYQIPQRRWFSHDYND